MLMNLLWKIEMQQIMVKIWSHRRGNSGEMNNAKGNLFRKSNQGQTEKLTSWWVPIQDDTVNSPKFTRQPASGGEDSTRERACERQLHEGDTCVLNQIWQTMSASSAGIRSVNFTLSDTWLCPKHTQTYTPTHIHTHTPPWHEFVS